MGSRWQLVGTNPAPAMSVWLGFLPTFASTVRELAVSIAAGDAKAAKSSSVRFALPLITTNAMTGAFASIATQNHHHSTIL
ncbi:unnamed protein product [Calypogeia fissa]